MGGQVSAGESIEQTLERETQEEAGLAIADLIDLRRTDRITRAPAGRRGLRRRAHRGVRGDRSGRASRRANQDGEVERFDCLRHRRRCSKGWPPARSRSRRR